MLVSVILPCYNPPENWAPNIIKEYTSLLEVIEDPMEIILVVDGMNPSPAAEIELLQKSIPAFTCISYPVNKGKGHAIRKGVEIANGEIILYTDVDFPYTRASIYKIYSALKNRTCDVAVGIKNDAYYAHVPFMRRVLSKGLSRLIRSFLSIPITDTQCGLKGFVKAIRPVFLGTRIERYLFDLEFIRSSFRMGYNLKAIQIELNENVRFRVMSYRILFPEIVNFMKLVLIPKNTGTPPNKKRT